VQPEFWRGTGLNVSLRVTAVCAVAMYCRSVMFLQELRKPGVRVPAGLTCATFLRSTVFHTSHVGAYSSQQRSCRPVRRFSVQGGTFLFILRLYKRSRLLCNEQYSSTFRRCLKLTAACPSNSSAQFDCTGNIPCAGVNEEGANRAWGRRETHAGFRWEGQKERSQ
jgi:hypothetical protein